MENYQFSQAVIGQLCIVSYRWLDNSIMSTIIRLVSRMENYQCSQAVIGQLCIVSYCWLANNIMSTIIGLVLRMENYQCSQAVIGQLCIVSYCWLANNIMSTIITSTSCAAYLKDKVSFTGHEGPRECGCKGLYIHRHDTRKRVASPTLGHFTPVESSRY